MWLEESWLFLPDSVEVEIGAVPQFKIHNGSVKIEYFVIFESF
jgi:hypothetical protein